VGELDRASEIINNLLSLNTLTRPERMQFQNVDLGPLIDIVVKRHQALAGERGIEIVCKKDDYRTVWGNAAALEQVVTNLLRNALAYTPKDRGGLITITIHPDYHGAIVLSVSDTGVGIAQKDLFHIFEPFYRAEPSRVRSSKEAGSGLGLTIVNEIVRVHHGKIHIESAKNKGTTVSVFIPAGLSEDERGGEVRRNTLRSEVSLDFSRSHNDSSRFSSTIPSRL
jgi:signal transduction histidine kinase